MGGQVQMIYMDPPYQGVCRSRDQRYAPKIDRDEFCHQLDLLNSSAVMYHVSYDGRTGHKRFGKRLPKSLGLKRVEVSAGRSTQATLHGRSHQTFESLSLSPALLRRADGDVSRLTG